ncbi:OmpA family protein [Nocardia takedensis]
MPHRKPWSTFDRLSIRQSRRGVAFGLIALVFASGVLTSCTTAPTDAMPSAITLIVTATSAEPRPALPDSVVDKLTAMAKHSKRKGDATVRIITSATGDILTKDLTPLRPNGDVQHASADAKHQIDASIEELAEALAKARADSSGLDLLALINRAGQLPGDIHVVSSGASTTAPVDLRVTGWNTTPARVADSAHRQGRITTMNGYHVTFHGLGIAAGSQPGFPPFARQWIEQLWVGICQRAGAASCVIAHDAPPAAAPVATMPVPVVPVPEAITEGGCPVWLNLSDAVLHFAGGSAVLPASADDALRPIVEATSRCAIRAIDITGHIADTGDGDDHDNLARRRANAVADWLLALGLPSGLLGAVSGHDAREPIIPNFTGGIFDESKAAANRRVEITFHQKGQ